MQSIVSGIYVAFRECKLFRFFAAAIPRGIMCDQTGRLGIYLAELVLIFEVSCGYLALLTGQHVAIINSYSSASVQLLKDCLKFVEVYFVDICCAGQLHIGFFKYIYIYIVCALPCMDGVHFSCL